MALESFQGPATASGGDNVSDRLRREVELIAALPQTLPEGVSKTWKHVAEEPQSIGVPLALSIGTGLGIAMLTRNPSALGGLGGVLARNGGKIAVAMLGVDLTERVAPSMVQAWNSQAGLTEAKTRLGDRLGAMTLDYPVMFAGGYAGIKMPEAFAPLGTATRTAFSRGVASMDKAVGSIMQPPGPRPALATAEASGGTAIKASQIESASAAKQETTAQMALYDPDSLMSPPHTRDAATAAEYVWKPQERAPRTGPSLAVGDTLQAPHEAGFVVTPRIGPRILLDRPAEVGRPAGHVELRDGFARNGDRVLLDDHGLIQSTERPVQAIPSPDRPLYRYADGTNVQWGSQDRLLISNNNHTVEVSTLADGTSIIDYPSGNARFLRPDRSEMFRGADNKFESITPDPNFEGRFITERRNGTDGTTVVFRENALGREKTTTGPDGKAVTTFDGKIVEYAAQPKPLSEMKAVTEEHPYRLVWESKQTELTVRKDGTVEFETPQGYREVHLRSNVQSASPVSATADGDASVLLRMEDGRQLELIHAGSSRFVVFDRTPGSANKMPAILEDATFAPEDPADYLYLRSYRGVLQRIAPERIRTGHYLDRAEFNSESLRTLATPDGDVTLIDNIGRVYRVEQPIAGSRYGINGAEFNYQNGTTIRWQGDTATVLSRTSPEKFSTFSHDQFGNSIERFGNEESFAIREPKGKEHIVQADGTEIIREPAFQVIGHRREIKAYPDGRMQMRLWSKDVVEVHPSKATILRLNSGDAVEMTPDGAVRVIHPERTVEPQITGWDRHKAAREFATAQSRADEHLIEREIVPDPYEFDYPAGGPVESRPESPPFPTGLGGSPAGRRF